MQDKKDEMSPVVKEVLDSLKLEKQKQVKKILIGVGFLLLSWACAKAGEAIQATGTDTLLSIAFGLAWIGFGIAGIVTIIIGVTD